MVQLRRRYLAYLGKPQNISDAIRKYNLVRKSDNKKILNSEDFFQRLKEIMETDLTRWIQAEGAYDLFVSGKVFKNKRQHYEKLVQKTLTSQIEYFFMRRGFQIQPYREPQLLDDKRTDILIRYGFLGPVVASAESFRAPVILAASRIPSFNSPKRSVAARSIFRAAFG
jgi:hypothetical protein